MTGSRAESFVAFAARIYAVPGVADATLSLQDTAGKDVNLLLYCLHAGLVAGRRLGVADLDHLAKSVEELNRVAVRPLQSIRRGLKPLEADPEIARFRQAVKSLELEAEVLVQHRLAGALSAGDAEPPTFDLARANLLSYAGDAARPLLHALDRESPV